VGLVAERLNLRLFIDGIEVPVVGGRCTAAESTIYAADIQVIATDEVYDLLPRSFVTLFVYNNYDYVDDPVSGEKDAIRIGPNDLRRWVLLFAGELVAVSLQKEGAGRTATLTCADPGNYWDFIRQQYINFSNAGVEMFEAAFLGVKQDRFKFFDVTTQDVNSKIYVWLTQSKNDAGKPNVSLGVHRVLREMFFSVNDFYGEAFNRLRIGDTIVGLPQDETAAKLFELEFFKKFIQERLDGAGGMVTARQLIDLLLGPVFHSYVTVPCPRFDRGGECIGFRPSATKSEDTDILKTIIDRSDSWPGATLNYTVIRPDMWFMAPPMCNVVFPHMYRSLSFGRNYLSEPTRLFLRTSLFFGGADKWMTERLYAPDFKCLNDLLYKQGGYLERLAGTLLPHEEFVGINPAMVWQEDVAAYVQKGPRREYLSQLTHYLFWKYRFGTRTVNVSGPLNLNLLPGYPALVVDRVAPNGGSGVMRHFIGHIASLVHSVDQNGGWTHFSMSGARVHDEQIDFDDTGRSLEEVVSRGTDGFLDDRYDVERIGPEVYQRIFGCDSIVDVLTATERTTRGMGEATTQVPRDLTTREEKQIKELTEDMLKTLEKYRAVLEGGNIQAQQQLSQYLRSLYAAHEYGHNVGNPFSMPEDIQEVEMWLRTELEKKIDAIKAGATRAVTSPVEVDVPVDLVPAAVAKLHAMYSAVVKAGQDVDRFTKTLTNRPKANFAELMGTDLANVPPSRNEVDDATTTDAALEQLWKQDLDIARYDGFFATAVNPAAKTTTENSYKAQLKTKTVTTTVTENVPVLNAEHFSPYGYHTLGEEAPTRPVTKTITSEVPTEKQGTYALATHLEARREKVQAYVDSLLLRGLRG
jgi:hypothetical protein